MPQTLRVRFTTDPASDTSPTWVDVTDDVRAFTTSRGRGDEFARVETGTGSIVLNNRDRQFDPIYDPLIRPMNRWWIDETITGETVFLGYAVSYTMSRPDQRGVDGICTVQLADEFMVLALDRLPAMDPPVASYKDVVLFDLPQGYWQMQGQEDVQLQLPTVGPMALSSGSMSRTASPILGDDTVDVVAGVPYGARSTTGELGGISGLSTADMQQGWPGDATGLSTLTYEQWFKSSEATPAADRVIAEGPYDTGGNVTWAISLSTTGKIKAAVRNVTPTVVTVTGATSISANTWYHIAFTYDGSDIRVYLNGVQDGTAAQTGAVEDADPLGAHFYLALGRGAPGGTRYYDEVAWYQHAVSAARLLAHYEAGALRGFASEYTDERVVSVMAASTSIATVDSFEVSARQMVPTFMRGQPVLDELRRAETAESVDAILFVSKSGEVTFLGDGHREWSPWNIEQALFDDDGTDLPYDDIEVDYSDSFLANEWYVTRTGGTTSSATDATSISVYRKRPQSLSDLAVVADADTDAIATAMLAKYKDPQVRITGLTVNTSRQAVADAVLALELADRIRVLHTQPDGGRIVQTCFVQRIAVQGRPGVPWIIQLGLEAVPEVEVAADGSFRGLLALMG